MITIIVPRWLVWLVIAVMLIKLPLEVALLVQRIAALGGAA